LNPNGGAHPIPDKPAPAGNRFTRQRRLLTAAQYAAVFAARRSLKGACFVLHYRFNDQGSSRLGLVIPKKQARTAVLRNAIKRQAREAFRFRCLDLPATDLVLRLAKPVERDAAGDPAARHAWRREIDGLFDALRAKAAV
jgi:ribonuclease P protein component